MDGDGGQARLEIRLPTSEQVENAFIVLKLCLELIWLNIRPSECSFVSKIHLLHLF